MEEARADIPSSDCRYFDYLGLEQSTRNPLLLVEAKSNDVPSPHKPYEPKLGGEETKLLVVEALNAIKRNDEVALTSLWTGFLRDLKEYVKSLEDQKPNKLKRAVISGGQWIIVFSDPWAVFEDASPTVGEHVHCFVGRDEILRGAPQLYTLLHRSCVTDSLPLTISVADAFRDIPAECIAGAFRAVLVETSDRGTELKRYPARSIYPGFVVKAGGRWFLIFDNEKPIDEPRNDDRIDQFLAAIDHQSTVLESRLSSNYGSKCAPSSVEDFPGFPADGRSVSVSTVAAPEPGSTSAMLQSSGPVRTEFVMPCNETGPAAEFVVVTGVDYFYKSDRSANGSCRFHSWKDARKEGVGARFPFVDCTRQSFTKDGQDRHCANNDFIHSRAGKCHIRAMDTNLCCEVCIFAFDCWPEMKN